jgi:UDP-N-acetylmuramate: L-alanyl-gamma-D-glutamyl-meso-diaminopimelate ligase
MRLYFMGICGTAMGHAALLARELGHDVCGADTGVYPPMSTVLRDAGIKIFEGYDHGRLGSLRPDLVIVGNVTTRGHDEMEWLLDTRALPYVSLPAFLGEIILRWRRNLVITGTHGKTTTATLAAFLLRSIDVQAGWLIGGVPRDLPGGALAGRPETPFVIEGDEYDSAFFDKRSKFIHYCPWLVTINNLEFDHADIFRDLADVQRSFAHLLKIVPRNGFALLNGDDPNVAALPPAPWTNLVRVGVEASCDLRIVDFSEDERGARFDLVWRGQHWHTVKWGLTGLFNARNAAMAALAAGLALDPHHPVRLPLAALESFQGVRRRQEVLRQDEKIMVVEDFGHHPTAIRETLVALRQRHPDRRLLACFEPRSNTARTRVFQAELPAALAPADHILIGPIHRGEKTPAAERLDLDAACSAINSEVAHLPRVMVKARHFDSNPELLAAALEIAREPENQPCLVVFFTNGSFDGIIAEFVAQA